MPLSVGDAPLADWTVVEMLKELGYGQALDAGTIEVHGNGEVTVKDVDGQVAFQGTQGTAHLGPPVRPRAVPLLGQTLAADDVEQPERGVVRLGEQFQALGLVEQPLGA